jgi:hypothetical protein
MVDVHVGDTVMLCQPRREPREATVTKVARVWITVGEGYREEKFRRDTQADGPDGYGKRFYTLTQWAEKRQRDEATTFLREQGIDLRNDSPWRDREIELAEVLRNGIGS